MSLMADAYIGLVEELTSDPDEQDYLYEHPEILEDLEKGFSDDVWRYLAKGLA